MGRAPARFEDRRQAGFHEDALLSVDLRDAIENPGQFADLLETEAPTAPRRLRSKLAVNLFVTTCASLLAGAVVLGVLFLA